MKLLEYVETIENDFYVMAVNEGAKICIDAGSIQLLFPNKLDPTGSSAIRWQEEKTNCLPVR